MSETGIDLGQKEQLQDQASESFLHYEGKRSSDTLIQVTNLSGRKQGLYVDECRCVFFFFFAFWSDTNTYEKYQLFTKML